MIEELVGFSSITAGFIVATISFYISTKYRMLSLSFVFLGGAFLSYGFAELYWYIFDSHGIEPYQTAIDIMYGFYYAFAILHVLTTLKSLKARLHIQHIIILIALISILMIVYSSLSYDAELEDFIFGWLFAWSASVLAAFALVTMMIMTSTSLSKSWILIGSSIFVASITDVWYYTQENLTGYEYGQFPLMDCLWFATDILIIIGIIIHRRKI